MMDNNGNERTRWIDLILTTDEKNGYDMAFSCFALLYSTKDVYMPFFTARCEGVKG
jgi:hypothetical protein